jgi:hypothetical protein
LTALISKALNAIRDHYREAVMLSAGMLRRVRAGQAPEAAAHADDDTPSFLREIHPGNAGDIDAASSSQ